MFCSIFGSWWDQVSIFSNLPNYFLSVLPINLLLPPIKASSFDLFRKLCLFILRDRWLQWNASCSFWHLFFLQHTANFFVCSEEWYLTYSPSVSSTNFHIRRNWQEYCCTPVYCTILMSTLIDLRDMETLTEFQVCSYDFSCDSHWCRGLISKVSCKSRTQRIPANLAHMYSELIEYLLTWAVVCSFTMNFSKGGGMIIAQYYQFLRLGFKGYQTIMYNLGNIAARLRQGLIDTGAHFSSLTYSSQSCLHWHIHRLPWSYAIVWILLSSLDTTCFSRWKMFLVVILCLYHDCSICTGVEILESLLYSRFQELIINMSLPWLFCLVNGSEVVSHYWRSSCVFLIALQVTLKFTAKLRVFLW